jgi:tetratricopeptide (TPR) repeat protein
LTETRSAELELMRASLLLDSDPAAAARAAGEILARNPGYPEASLLLASASRRLGQSKEAIAVLESLAETHRDSAFMQLELGRAYAESGRTSAAIAALRRAVAIDQGLADAWHELATQLFATGDNLGGDTAYGHFFRLAPNPPELTDAAVALAENRLETAESLLKQRLRKSPHDVLALRMLGEIATLQENLAEAESRLTTCLALAPGYAHARYDLANLLHMQHRDSEVLPLVERLLAAEPDNIDYLSLKAHALRLLGRITEAIALMDQGVTAHPNEERAWLLYGHLLREVGQQPGAIEKYHHVIQIRPQYGHAYSALANLKTYRFDPAEVAAMRVQLSGGALRRSERTHFEFALGKALEDEGRFEESFEHYANGNSLQRSVVAHDADAVTSDAKLIQTLFSREFFAERSGWGSASAEPIFIVGLPRSGSTLLEQILATHSQVEGTRELVYMPALAFETVARPNQATSRPYPESLATLERNDFEALAARYLARVAVLRELARPRFVDKMLANFTHIGFIQLLFPNAAIIDTRRHPLACGFSCYKQQFARGFGFTYDLSDMGRYYRDYAGLMDHFDAVLPGRVHRVHYEQVVADPDGEIRKLLDYCGLPFEAQCLQFHRNRRVVQTISSEQVRRPIYADSVDQWRNYEPWLEPMRKALGDLVERYPDPRPPGA